MNRFWVVMKDSVATMQATRRHPTRDIAEQEAMRLAGREQTKFVVFEAVSYAEPAERPAELHQTEIAVTNVTEEIPF